MPFHVQPNKAKTNFVVEGLVVDAVVGQKVGCHASRSLGRRHVWLLPTWQLVLAAADAAPCLLTGVGDDNEEDTVVPNQFVPIDEVAKDSFRPILHYHHASYCYCCCYCRKQSRTN